MKTVTIAVCAMFVSSTAFAQKTTASQSEKALVNKVVTETAVMPLLRSDDGTQANLEPQVTLLASNDGTTAKAKFGYLITDKVGFSVVLSGPVSGGGAKPVSSAGLGKGASVDSSLTFVLGRKVTTSAGTAATRDKIGGAGSDLAEAARGLAVELRSGKVKPTSPLFNLDTFLDQRNKDQLAGTTGTLDLTQVEDRRLLAAATRILMNDTNAWRVERAWLVTLTDSAARPAFTVAEESGFRSAAHHVNLFSGSVGFLKTRKNSNAGEGYYIGFKMSAGTAIEGEPENTCVPTGTILQCKDAVLTEPKPETRQIYQAEWRSSFARGKAAIGARFTYDAESKARALELPIYFIPKSEDLVSGLTGDKAGLVSGVTLSWKHVPGKDDQFAVLFVIGSLFKLPGLPH